MLAATLVTASSRPQRVGHGPLDRSLAPSWRNKNTRVLHLNTASEKPSHGQARNLPTVTIWAPGVAVRCMTAEKTARQPLDRFSAFCEGSFQRVRITPEIRRYGVGAR